ncbi:MAG: hypothetical protein JXB48_16445 [Candidatus Latescibacteria bacterium]|nr:hypothetical protein [Candidatus Latescibacterota bacterium]
MKVRKNLNCSNVSFIFCLFLFTSLNIFGQDLNIKLEESRTLELDYYGNFNYDKSSTDIHSTYNISNQIILNRTIEEKHTGNWLKLNGKLSNYKSGDYKNRNATWTTEFGSKRYLGNSPFFLYSSFEGSQYNVTSESKNDGVNTMIFGGTGGGRVVDLANYLRAKKVEKALITEGILSGEIPRETFAKVINTLRQKKETLKRVVELNRILSEAGLLDKDKFDIDTTFLLAEIIDESTDRLESGFEGRFGYAHELSRQDKNDDKVSYLTGMLKYAKPLTHQLEFSEVVDYYHSLKGDIGQKDITSTVFLKYDVTKTQITGSYVYKWERDDYDDLGRKDTTTTHTFEIRYRYEIYNKINISAVFSADKQNYKSEYDRWGLEDYEDKPGWNREIMVSIGYEIY